MKRIANLIACALMGCMMFAGCEQEKKVVAYNDIYSEKPTTIYIAPLTDNMQRKFEKYPKDKVYNNELNVASKYMWITAPTPLINHGYYVIGPVASEQIAAETPLTAKELKKGNLKVLNTKYGIDAVLSMTIHRWMDRNGEWTAYVEYSMRSTKTNMTLMHTYVKATKKVNTNLKGNPVPLKADQQFAEYLDVDNGSAQRAYLLQQLNDYVLRNIPISVTRRQFEEDMYKAALPSYFTYVWNEDGQADVQPCSMEEYEQEAFL